MVAVIDSPGDIATPPAEDAVVATAERRRKHATDKLTSHIVLWSFVAAVVLAIAGFMVVAIYLFRYFNHAVDAFAPSTMGQLAGMHTNAMQSMLLARTGLWKFILQSCGIIAGVAFGFLGFALFLLGVKGDMDAAFDDSRHCRHFDRSLQHEERHAGSAAGGDSHGPRASSLAHRRYRVAGERPGGPPGGHAPRPRTCASFGVGYAQNPPFRYSRSLVWRRGLTLADCIRSQRASGYPSLPY
jgi:hypothetical protein